MVVGEFTQETQLVVIGGGPGGHSAAFRAAELGIQTVLVDARESLGGVCLHEGCIPSKTLLHVVQTLRSAERACQFGVHFDKPRIDLDAVHAWLDQTAGKMAASLKQLCQRHGVEHIQGQASFEDGRRLNVRDSAIPRIRFRRAIIATGSRPAPHPVLEFDGRLVLSPYEGVRVRSVPESLLVVGGNYNAVELASIYAAFGTQVTLVHDADRLLPDADADLIRPLINSLEQRLHQVMLRTEVVDAHLESDGLTVTLRGMDVQQVRFDCAIVSVGYTANTEGLGLDRAGLAVGESGFIRVDDQMRTSDQRIFAVGDVAIREQRSELLADRASAEGRVAAEVIAGWNSRLDNRAIPVAVFTDPEIAWCGLTETQAKQRNVPYLAARQAWSASGRAIGMGQPDGVTKILYDADTQLILGMGVAGPHATELISEAALAIEMGAVISDLAAIVHPYATLGETFTSAALRAELHEQE